MNDKRIAIINSYCWGSTGKIADKIGDYAADNGYKVLKCFPKHKSNIEHKKADHCLFGTPFFYKINDRICRVTGLYGSFQFNNTYDLIGKLKDFNPDIVHLHNLHSSYVNLGMLFKYLKKKNVKVVWTLHDCWAFTGHCAHFITSGCEKWKTGCGHCKRQNIDYPRALIDVSKLQWKRKKRLFKSVEDLVLVTPSKWLSDLAKQSFFKDTKCVVINNGIDLECFKPTKGSFREDYNISNDTKILLGVAFNWSDDKGLDIFIELAASIGEEYRVVLVGTDDVVDKALPENVISIHRTANQKELAEIYSSANLFIIPTRVDNYPTVIMESIACGTPVVTFNTGGCSEIIDSDTGCVVEKNDFANIKKEVLSILETDKFSKEACLKRAQLFDVNKKYSEYIDLYNSFFEN